VFALPNYVRRAEPAISEAGKVITVALAGNPNSGKTTIFNALTGARQHVGNYPGVTVEKKEGSCRHGRTKLNVIDLPGTYSLTAYSAEELIARDVLIHDKPDAVIDILDASNLERNLYLAVQIMELGVPLVLALNMSDVAKQRGLEFDLNLLQKLLGAPIVPTVGHKGTGREALLDAAVEAAGNPKPRSGLKVDYGREIEAEIGALRERIEQVGIETDPVLTRWLAVKLLEGDAAVRERIADKELIAAAEGAARRLESLLGDSAEALIADRRYGFISGACQEAVRSTVESRHTLSDRIDSVVTSRILGLPIFAVSMFVVFLLTFTLGKPLADGMQAGVDWLGQAAARLWPAGSESPLKSLLTNGIISGVGNVLVFLPNIMLLFLAIAFLEDSGYMARAAFIMDRLMHKIGLHGKSFIPMLVGFGCTVPAIMATRTLENRRDRLVTILVLPFMSCGARLPIYVLLIGAFFPQVWQAPMLWIIYTIGILLAIAAAKMLRSTLFKGESVPFVMELPPYRMPTLRGVLIHMWERGGQFLKKAGTIILGVSILMWALSVWPKPSPELLQRFDQERSAVEGRRDLSSQEKQAMLSELNNARAESRLEHSAIARIGRAIAPALRPLGFDWKISTSLLGAFAAKEVFVSDLGIVYSVGQSDEESQSLRQKLQQNYTSFKAFCIMLFCLITCPCMATVAITRRESGSWKWALFQAGGLTLLAYVVTLVVFQGGRLLGLGV
jgi:ferrous iron transport protein B